MTRNMEHISVNGEKYVKASSIARELGYTADYVGQLARSGKIEAQLVGRSWFVNERSIKEHKRGRYRSTAAKSRESLRESLESFRPSAERIVAPDTNYARRAVYNSLQYEPDMSEVLPTIVERDDTDEEIADIAEPEVFEEVSEAPLGEEEDLDEPLKETEVEEEVDDELETEKEAEIRPGNETEAEAADDANEVEIEEEVSVIPIRAVKRPVRREYATHTPHAHRVRPRDRITSIQTPAKQVVVVGERSGSGTLFAGVLSLIIAIFGFLAFVGLESRMVAEGEQFNAGYQFNLAAAAEAFLKGEE